MPDPAPSSASPAPRKPLKRALITLLKVAIAILGIWFVLRNVEWNDSATIAKDTTFRNLTFVQDTPVIVLGQTPSRQSLASRINREVTTLPAQLVQIRFTDKPLLLRVDGQEISVVVGDAKSQQLNIPREIELPLEFFAIDEKGQQVREGFHTLLVHSGDKWYLLLAAWALLVIPFLVSAIRWRGLMQPQGITMPLAKCLQLTFVGQFYSIMLPGITGGDLVKIVYTARLTGSKTKSIVTILLDRVIGLTALMVIAGVSAGLQLLKNHRHEVSGATLAGDSTLRNVVLLIAAILGSMTLFSIVYFSRRLRTLTGLQRLIDHSHMPDFIKHADEVLHTYRGHFGLLAWSFGISLISQLTLPVSAWLSGLAFGVHMNIGYYLAYVPVAIIAVSLPSLPQGVGVLDGLMIHFLANRGMATGSQAFAIAQAVRFLPILWNLVGVYWVLTGRFSRHQAVEEERQLDAAEHQP